MTDPDHASFWRVIERISPRPADGLKSWSISDVDLRAHFTAEGRLDLYMGREIAFSFAETLAPMFPYLIDSRDGRWLFTPRP